MPVYEIGSGQTRRQLRKVFVEHEVQIERASEAELESALKLGSGPVGEVSAKVRALIRERTQVRSYARTERTLEETAALSKADDEAGVIHRRIEMAPTFLRRRALLRITCECCGEIRIVPVNMRQWTGRYRQKQIDTSVKQRNGHPEPISWATEWGRRGSGADLPGSSRRRDARSPNLHFCASKDEGTRWKRHGGLFSRRA